MNEMPMKKFDYSRRWAGWAMRLGLIALLFTLFAAPKAALAHPADVYLQATYITSQPTQIVVELKITPGMVVAPELLAKLDVDGDEQIVKAEWQASIDVPSVLTPILQTLSGLLVVYLGVQLVWQRWITFRDGQCHNNL